MRRLGWIAMLLLLWTGFGFGVNRFIAVHRSAAVEGDKALLPDKVESGPQLGGTVYLVQGGDIYRLHAGKFTKLALPRSGGYWLQPATVPGRSEILAVFRAQEYSDLYLIDGSSGRVVRQITHNATATKVVQANHWVFSPTLSGDGNTLFSAYDSPKIPGNFLVDLAIWSGTLDGHTFAARWSTPNDWTGGDVDPSSVANDGVIYAEYQLTGNEQIASQLVWRTDPRESAVYLTTLDQNCTAPSVSPQGDYVAAVCAGSNPGYTKIEVFSLTPAANGSSRGEIDLQGKDLTSDCLCASPAWSPDGKALLYLAPQDASGHFQLWSVAGPGSAHPGVPKRLTDGLDFDATSPPVWAAQ